MKFAFILLLFLFALVSSIPVPYYDPEGPATDKEPFENIAHYQTYQHIQLFTKTATQGPFNFATRYAAYGRSFVVASSCAYDTWAVITGSPTIYSGYNVSRVDDNSKNINKAIAYAYHRAVLHTFAPLDPNYFPSQVDSLFLTQLGYSLPSSNLSPAAKLGIDVCRRILDIRAHDLTNADGREPLGSGVPYSDFTAYKAPNDPMPFVGMTVCNQLRGGPGLWQPARVFRPPNGNIVLNFAEALFANAKTWGLKNAAEFRPSAPFSVNTSSDGWKDQINQLLNVFENLDDSQKVIASYWQYGEGYGTGYFIRVAMTALRIKKYSLSQSLRVYFMISNAVYEALIAEYDGKRFFNPGRPTTAVQCQYEGQKINSWAGPWLGVKTIDASTWQAYLPNTVVTNANPEYPCGHCTVSASASVILTKVMGERFIGVDYIYPEGSSPIDPKITVDDNDPRFISGLTDVPNHGPDTIGYVPAQDIRLSWDSWDDWANQARISRTWLGVHFIPSGFAGRELGRKIGQRIWDNSQYLLLST